MHLPGEVGCQIEGRAVFDLGFVERAARLSCACRACRACVVRTCACSPTQGHLRSAHTAGTRARSRSYPPARESPRFGVGRRDSRDLDVRRVLELGDSGSHDQRDAREKKFAKFVYEIEVEFELKSRIAYWTERPVLRSRGYSIAIWLGSRGVDLS